MAVILRNGCYVTAVTLLYNDPPELPAKQPLPIIEILLYLLSSAPILIFIRFHIFQRFQRQYFLSSLPFLFQISISPYFSYKLDPSKTNAFTSLFPLKGFFFPKFLWIKVL